MPDARLQRTRAAYELEAVQRYRGPLRFHRDAFSSLWEAPLTELQQAADRASIALEALKRAREE